MFIKGFTQGPPKSHSGPKRALFGPEMLKIWKFQLFWWNGVCVAGTLRKTPNWHSKSIGLRKGLEMCKMVKFLEISLFYAKFHVFIGNIKKVVAEFAKKQFSAPARPGCARPYKTNAIPSLFRGSWRPGAHFRKKSLFHKIITKIEKSDFSQILAFLVEINIFAKIAGSRKHQ